MDFKDMLLDAMKQGASLEDVMKGISDAATEVEKEQKKANDLKDKYLKFTKPIGEVYSRDILESNLFDRKKLYAEDVALVITHYICQNVPDYIEFAAKKNLDLLELYKSLVESQLLTARVMATRKDKSDGDILGSVIDALWDTIFKDGPSDGKCKCGCTPPPSNPFPDGPSDASESDVNIINRFLSRFDLPKW